MSIETIQRSGWGLKLTYFSIIGLTLAGIVAHAQYATKVGEVTVIVLIPIVIAFCLAYACGPIQRRIERGMRVKRLKPTHGKGAKSRYMFGSYQSEVMIKTVLVTLGGFAAIYFFLSLCMIAAPPLISFVISIDAAGIFMLVYPAYLEDKSVIKKK
ncbi:MAG TPA: hypothetical protein VKM55_16915 [Candidatus Lokiarchaeia archaeon]|nr:hypothetical protein [Candidatus Lokiarchaeia archaeon]